MDSYRIPTGNGASEYVEKRSRFLGLVQPVSSEDEAREIIAACKKQYHDARHNCWCYLLRDGTERYSDDGEPQGTAGIPMLEVFRRAGVTNVVCVVTRYFGVVQETQYAAAVTLCALLPEEAGEAFAAQVRDLTAGRCAVRPVGETERAVPLADAGL